MVDFLALFANPPYTNSAVMPPYRGLKECPACHSHPGLYATAGDWMGDSSCSQESGSRPE